MIHTRQMKFRGGHTSKTEVINLVVDVVNLIMLSKIGIPRLKSKVQRKLPFVRKLYGALRLVFISVSVKKNFNE